MLVAAVTVVMAGGRQELSHELFYGSQALEYVALLQDLLLVEWLKG